MLQDVKLHKRKILLIAAGSISSIFLVFFVTLLLMTRAPSDGSRHIDFAVQSGWGPVKVTSALYENELIQSRTFFSLYMRLVGKSMRIKKGVYDLTDGLTAGQIIDIITSGKTKTIAFTIPEGYNNRQIGDVLTEKKFFSSRKEFMEFSSKKNILDKFHIPAATTEGYLFPDTYYLPPAYPKEKIITLMLRHFFDKVKELKDLPSDPKKIHDVVILASIIEREAQLKEERPLVAGVFANRLRDKEPLESCATIQYLFDKQHKRIFFKDLEIQSPYNTYKNAGLPPSPIASPGLAALGAALKPAPTEFKFFVVRGDGGHQFSKSYSDHIKAKKKYLGGD